MAQLVQQEQQYKTAYQDYLAGGGKLSDPKATELLHSWNQTTQQLGSLAQERNDREIRQQKAIDDGVKQDERRARQAATEALLLYGFDSDEYKTAAQQADKARQTRLDAGASAVLRAVNTGQGVAARTGGALAQSAATLMDPDKELLDTEASRKYLRLQQNLQEKANSLYDTAAEKDAAAKHGLGKGGRFAVDALSTAMEVGGDMLLNAVLPGAGLVATGARAAGSGMRQAHEAGADAGDQLLYGLLSAGAEIGLEKLGGVLDLAYGRGATELLSEQLLRNLPGDALRSVGRGVIGAAGAGAEEAASVFLDPFLQAVYDDGAAAKAAYGSPEGRAKLLSDAAYAFGLGATVSDAEGQVKKQISGLPTQQQAAQRATAEALRRSIRGNPAAQTAAQAQTAAPTAAAADPAQAAVDAFEADGEARETALYGTAGADGSPNCRSRQPRPSRRRRL